MSAPKTAIKSQLEVMAGTVATVAPQSTVARLVHGELKGGEAKQAFIMSVIRESIIQSLKGNTRDIPEAMKLCEGKAVKAKAFFNGFTAIADHTAKVEYKGKFDAKENAAVRDEVMMKADAVTLMFKSAYMGTFDAAKAESDKNRAAKKAEKEAEQLSKDRAAFDAAGGDASAPAITVNADVPSVAGALDIVVDAIRIGSLDSTEMLMLRAALAVYDEAQEQAAPALMAA